MYMLTWIISNPMIFMWSLISGAFAYATFYCLLHCIKNPVNIALGALLLLVFSSLAMLTCPIIDIMFKHMVKMETMKMEKMVDKIKMGMMKE